MSYNIIIPRPVQKQLQQLPQKIYQKITEKILELINEPAQRELESLKDLKMNIVLELEIIASVMKLMTKPYQLSVKNDVFILGFRVPHHTP